MIIYQTNFLFIKRVFVLCASTFEITEAIKKKKPDLVVFGNIKQYNGVGDNLKKSLTYSYDFKPCTNKDVFFSEMSKDLRYEIRKCQRDEEVEIKIFENKSISKKMIVDACKMGNSMFKSKGMKTRIKKASYLSQRKAECLMMSISYYKGTPYTYHAYSIDGNNAICSLIATSYREKAVSGKKSGMIHRYHSYRDMEYFNDRKYSYFDWGGLSSFDNPNGIDKFKMRFPGYQNITVGKIVCLSRTGKIFMNIKKLLKR